MRWWLENRLATLQFQVILIGVVIVGLVAFNLVASLLRWLF